MNEDRANPFDIGLILKDGKQLQAHRNVLSKASPFFEKLLSSDMKESNEGVIRLHTITESLMTDILQFIYNGSVQITSKENAEKLIETADFLLLSNLKTIAGKSLEQHITTETCISMNYLAEQYSCKKLVASTRKFINSNFITVTASEEFLNLPNYEVEKWISSNEIVIDAEENVFEIILRWIDHDESERSGKFGELFNNVRLTYVSRDYLLSHVVTNDRVKENVDCLYSVTCALAWLDRPTDSDVPRPHPPRKALKVDIIVIADGQGEMQRCVHLPATDEWYLLPAATERQQHSMEDVVCTTVSCEGKVFFITFNLARSQCYDPHLNRWSPAPWTDNLAFQTGRALVVKNRICLLGVERHWTDLWTYSFDSNSFTPLRKWVEICCFCVVAVESYLYVIGGSKELNSQGLLSECARFDTEENEWQKIAPLNQPRTNAFGVCKNEKIFIAGGSANFGTEAMLKTCEAYNVLTDEWHFIASLTFPRLFGSMVLVEDTLYVLGGFTREREWRYKVECYNHESDEWNVKTTVPVNKIAIKKEHKTGYAFQGCSLRVCYGVLTNLESIE